MLIADHLLMIFFFHILEPIPEDFNHCLRREKPNQIPLVSKSRHNFVEPFCRKSRDKKAYFLKIRG